MVAMAYSPMAADDTIHLAATLILLRDGASKDAAPEILMMERAASMVFAPGALVFPGGRVDRPDIAFAGRLAAESEFDVEDVAARLAAIRETIEESGIAIALSPAPSPSVLNALREGLCAGQSFEDLLATYGLGVELDRLTLFARWIPPEGVHRRFDTRFYVARAAHDAVEIVDGSESVHAFWADAARVMAEADAGRHRVIFPTRCNLERLARLPNFDAVVADALAHGHHVAISREEFHGGESWVCIDDDIGYPLSAMPTRLAFRG